MTRVAWFNGFSGISGDMALGALIDAGAAVDEVHLVVAGRVRFGSVTARHPFGTAFKRMLG